MAIDTIQSERIVENKYGHRHVETNSTVGGGKRFWPTTAVTRRSLPRGPIDRNRWRVRFDSVVFVVVPLSRPKSRSSSNQSSRCR